MQTLVTLDKWTGSLKLIKLDSEHNIMWCDTFTDKLFILGFCMVVYFGNKINYYIATNK